MALDIEKVIDLTAYAGNPAPKVVSQLSIIHESSDGELVQYYIETVNHSQGDKQPMPLVYTTGNRSPSATTTTTRSRGRSPASASVETP